jgi:hypothetical protein
VDDAPQDLATPAARRRGTSTAWRRYPAPCRRARPAAGASGLSQDRARLPRPLDRPRSCWTAGWPRAAAAPPSFGGQRRSGNAVNETALPARRGPLGQTSPQSMAASRVPRTWRQVAATRCPTDVRSPPDMTGWLANAEVIVRKELAVSAVACSGFLRPRRWRTRLTCGIVCGMRYRSGDAAGMDPRTGVPVSTGAGGRHSRDRTRSCIVTWRSWTCP